MTQGLSRGSASDPIWQVGTTLDASIGLAPAGYSAELDPDLTPAVLASLPPPPASFSEILSTGTAGTTSVVQSPTSYPWDCVCYITVNFAGVGNFRGSGVIIGPHTILTASHMVWDADANESATVTGITPGYPSGTGISGPFTIHFFQVDDRNSQLTRQQSQFDYAIIDVKQDLSAYGSFGTLANYSGGTVHATGYPAVAGSSQTDVTGTATPDSSYSVLDYGTLSGQISGGNSGGPLWIDQDPSSAIAPYIVGIVSTSAWVTELTTDKLTQINSWVTQDGYTLSTAIAGSVSINDVSIAEGDSGTSLMTFTVTRTGGTSAFDVSFSTSNWSASTADNDYQQSSGLLHFGANVNSMPVSISITGDTKIEADETFFVILSNATNGATVSDNTGVGTIVNDDAGPGSVSINDVSIAEGNSGTSVMTFTVTRTGGTAAFDVNFSTSNWSASTADGDYQQTSGVLHFGANVNSMPLSVVINGDTKPEADENFFVVLTGTTNGAAISDNLGSGTIVNDDAVPGAVSINDVSITEGDSGTKLMTFTVTRTGGTAAFDVNFGTSNWSASTADNDYQQTSGVLHFGANVNSMPLSVTINGDTKAEADENFFVVLTGTTNGATISDNLGSGTILNDDAAGSSAAALSAQVGVVDPWHAALTHTFDLA